MVETAQKFVVTIAEPAPHLFLGDRSLAIEALESALGELLAEHPDLDLSIRPDEMAPIGMLVDVIDAAKGANITNFRLEAKLEPTE